LLVLDLSVRRNAQSQALPHVAAGTTPPDQPWHPWAPGGGDGIVGFETVVDVSAWGFASPPTFLAMLAVDAGAALFGRMAEVVDLVLAHVAPDPDSPTGRFLFRVVPPVLELLDPTSIGENAIVASSSFRSPLRVNWLGIEPAAGCPPDDQEVLGKSVRCCVPAPQPFAGRRGGVG
jgi:hypothetical protein